MRSFICCALLLASTWASAAVDLVACTRDGQPIPEVFCNSLRRAEEDKQWRLNEPARQASAAQRAQEAAALKAESDRVQRQRDEETAQQVAAAEKRQQDRIVWDAENLRKQRAELDRMQRSDENVRAKAQKACGEDFGVPRVGMTLDRAKQCLGYAKLVGQVNRADGVASVYTNGRVQLFVMENKVVAWQATR
jgi:hypothetical protein